MLKHFISAFTITIFCHTAIAEIKSMDAVLKKMPAAEKKDLSALLQQIHFAPIKGASNSKPIFKIISVEKGSVWDKEGFKAGDMVQMGNQ